MTREELEAIVEQEYREELSRDSSPTGAYWAYWGVGRLAAMGDEWEKAILAYQKAIAADPTNTMAWQHLGLAYADSKDNEKAIDCFQKCIDLQCQGLHITIEEDNPYFHLGWCYADLGNFAKAEEVFKKDLELLPAHYNAYLRLARLYYAQERWGELADLLQHALDIAAGTAKEPSEYERKELEAIKQNLDEVRERLTKASG